MSNPKTPWHVDKLPTVTTKERKSKPPVEGIVKDMTEDFRYEYPEIEKEAYKRFRQANRGAAGQTIEVENFLDYWVYVVTREKYEGKYG